MANHLTPTELAREAGLDRRDVIVKCVELGVPIFNGRIDKTLFLSCLGEVVPAPAGAATGCRRLEPENRLQRDPRVPHPMEVRPLRPGGCHCWADWREASRPSARESFAGARADEHVELVHGPVDGERIQRFCRGRPKLSPL